MPTVLVVDDDIATLDFARQALGAAGFRVQAATSARAALDLLARQPVDAVVLEIILPEKEGVETIVEILRRWPGLAVVAMSAGGVLVGAAHALSLAVAVGAHRALLKPFTAAALVEALDQALGRRVA